jgi:predicted ester cyclase
VVRARARPGDQGLDRAVPGQLPPTSAWRALVAEGDKVVGRFTCSAAHPGAWLGHAATGRRFDRVDEVAIFQLGDGGIVHARSLEDNLGRLRSSA